MNRRLSSKLLIVIILIITEIQICSTPFIMVMNRPEGSPLYKWVNLIYTEVFSRMGTELSVNYYPIKRASYLANSGQADGEPARIYNYNETFTNLIRVEESVITMKVAAYSSNPEIKGLKGWESLKQSPWNVEYLKGMKINEYNLKRIGLPVDNANVTETIQGLKKLAAGRNDIYIDDMNSVGPLLHSLRLKDGKKIHVAGIMEQVPLYMFVHKKHRKMTNTLSQVIRDMKEEGLIEKYHEMAFGITEPDGFK